MFKRLPKRTIKGMERLKKFVPGYLINKTVTVKLTLRLNVGGNAI